MDPYAQGHWIEVETTEIDPEVQAFITKCQNLMLALGRYQERAYNHLSAAKTALETCKTDSEIESENISGIYYEDHYLPYREGFFTLGDSINAECDTCISEISDRISTLSSLISEASIHLYRTVTRQEWVSESVS